MSELDGRTAARGTGSGLAEEPGAGATPGLNGVGGAASGEVGDAEGAGPGAPKEPAELAAAPRRDSAGNGTLRHREPTRADRPGMPSGAGPWDARSGEWLTGDLGGGSIGGGSGSVGGLVGWDAGRDSGSLGGLAGRDSGSLGGLARPDSGAPGGLVGQGTGDDSGSPGGVAGPGAGHAAGIPGDVAGWGTGPDSGSPGELVEPDTRPASASLGDRAGWDAGPRSGSPDGPAGPGAGRDSGSLDDPARHGTAPAPGSPADPMRRTSAPAGPRVVPEARADVGAERKRALGPRRGPGDPVKTLLHRHRELCERAVDPLEIAAGLEAHGLTDRAAARFRHRDVFSLAEELYARVPRTTEPRPRPEALPAPRVRAGWVLLTLLPGALGAATVTGLRLTHGHPRLLVALGGLLAVALATRAALRHGPLAGPPGTRAWDTALAARARRTEAGPRAPHIAMGTRARRTAIGTRAWTLWLLGYALAGDGLLHAVLAGGPDTLPTGAPDGPWPLATAPVLALLSACAPAAWSAHLLAAGARRRLAGSRGLEDFTAAVKPLLLGVSALFLGALAALLALCGTVLHAPAALPQDLTLGALLLLARLLTVHRHRRAPALALGAAAATEAAALALPLAGRLPGCAVLAAPVDTLVGAWGEAAVPALACGTAALALLWHAGRTLTRASAHAPTGAPE